MQMDTLGEADENAIPLLHIDKAVHLVTFPRVTMGKTLLKRIPVFLAPDLPPSMSASGLDIEYVIRLSGKTDNGRTFQTSSSAFKLLRTTSSAPMASDEDDVAEWVDGPASSLPPIVTSDAAAHDHIQGGSPQSSPIDATKWDGPWRQIQLDQWIDGSLPFQSSALFYYDHDAEHTGGLTKSPSIAHEPIGVCVVSNNPAGLRISKAPNKPSWMFFDKAEESRTLLPDGSEEYLCSLGGSGRYYIAVFGNTLNANTHYELSVRRIQGLKDSSPFMFLFTIRANYKGGLHLGKFGSHMPFPTIPYGGLEVEIKTEFEVLTEIPGSRWVQVLSGAGVPPNAIPCGHEEDGRIFYLGRATVKESLIPGLSGASTGWMGSLIGASLRTSLCPGKAGPHMSGCNVAFGGSEYSGISPYEILVFDDAPDYDQ
eukprot:jgi/Hompol1/194/HPOL_005257-RA